MQKIRKKVISQSWENNARQTWWMGRQTDEKMDEQITNELMNR